MRSTGSGSAEAAAVERGDAVEQSSFEVREKLPAVSVDTADKDCLL